MLYLLGTPRVEINKQIVNLPLTKAAFLLVYLAYRQSWVSRQELSDIFWPNDHSESNLRVLIHRSQQLNWSKELEVDPTKLRFSVETDLKLFHKAIQKGQWYEALDLYNPFLENYSFKNIKKLQNWKELEGQAINSSWRNILLQQIYLLEQQKDFDKILQLLESSRQKDKNLDISFDLTHKSPILPISLSGISSKSSIDVSTKQSKSLSRPDLIGREQILNQINGNQKPIVLLNALAGMGKTRLLEEISSKYLFRCREGMENIPYFPIINWLENYDLSKFVELKPYQADLVHLLPQNFPNVRPSPIETEGHTRLFFGLKKVLEILIADKRLVIDDLQWTDCSTLQLIKYLEQSDWQIIGAYRSDEVNQDLQKAINSWLSGNRLGKIEIKPLSKEDLVKFISNTSNNPHLAEQISQKLFTFSGGNPFFLLQTLNELFDNGSIIEQDSHWIIKSDNELKVPDTVSAVIKRRLSQLGQNSLKFMKIASVLGQDIDAYILSKIENCSEWSTIEALSAAENLGLIHENNFEHDLIRQTIKSNLSNSEKKYINRQIAERIGNKLSPSIAASHWFEAGDKEKAAELWLKAAEDFVNTGYYDEAEHIFSNLRQLDLKSTELIRFNLCQALRWAKIDKHELVEPLLDGLDISQLINHPEICANFVLIKSNLLVIYGKADQALLLFDQIFAQTSVENLGFFESRLLYAYISLLRVLHQYQKVIEIGLGFLNNHTQLKFSPDSAESSNIIRSYNAVGRAYISLGDTKNGLIYLDKAAILTQKSSNLSLLTDMYSQWINWLLNLKQIDTAKVAIDHFLSLSKQLMITDNLDFRIETSLARIYSASGEFEKAINHFETALNNASTLAQKINVASLMAKSLHDFGNIEKSAMIVAELFENLSKIHNVDLHISTYISIIDICKPKDIEKIIDYLNTIDVSLIYPLARQELQQKLSAFGYDLASKFQTNSE